MKENWLVAHTQQIRSYIKGEKSLIHNSITFYSPHKRAMKMTMGAVYTHMRSINNDTQKSVHIPKMYVHVLQFHSFPKELVLFSRATSISTLYTRRGGSVRAIKYFPLGFSFYLFSFPLD
ncbi:unnamed protein product [Orchesella dallaii]|uniref:Uncharacterized protein n=1 Tax=Orchesella dallaii TaxID=48710 RepID=A0ABP1R3Q2_9HEXA